MSSQVWWYLSRASGIVAWLLLVAGFLWGVLLVSRLLGPAPRPAWMLDLHRWLGGLAVVFTGVHLGALVADSYVHFDLIDLVVPFAAEWKPAPVAWGVVALWLLLAVEVTSLLMRRLPRQVWRWIHLSSYLLLWMATIHGVLAGTDAANPAVRVGLVSLVTIVVTVVGHRVVRGSAKDRRIAARRSEGSGRSPVPGRSPLPGRSSDGGAGATRPRRDPASDRSAGDLSTEATADPVPDRSLVGGGEPRRGR